MKKFIKTTIVSLLALGIIAPLGTGSASARTVKNHPRVYRLARHHKAGHRRYRRSRRSYTSTLKQTSPITQARHQTKHNVRLGSDHDNTLNSVVAEISKEDAPALRADRSSLEQVKASVKEIAHEAKTDHLDRKTKREYLKEARSLYRQANQLLAECN